MPVDDDSDSDNGGPIEMACCWVCLWKYGDSVRNDTCTGLYHELVELLNIMYPPHDVYYVDPRETRLGSLGKTGPIVHKEEPQVRVWIPKWQGHRLSFVQSVAVLEADRKREQDKARYALLEKKAAAIENELAFNRRERNRRDEKKLMLDDNEKAHEVKKEKELENHLRVVRESLAGLAEYSNTHRLTPAPQRADSETDSETDDAGTLDQQAERVLLREVNKS